MSGEGPYSYKGLWVKGAHPKRGAMASGAEGGRERAEAGSVTQLPTSRPGQRLVIQVKTGLSRILQDLNESPNTSKDWTKQDVVRPKRKP